VCVEREREREREREIQELADLNYSQGVFKDPNYYGKGHWLPATWQANGH
jgi:hypothetical protein